MTTAAAAPSSTGPTIRRRIPKSQRRRDGLIQYAYDHTSQNGEDGVIAKIFELLPSDDDTRYCVDVGAWDGKHLSNTYSLLVGEDKERQQQQQTLKCRWKGVLIEADSERFQELDALHQPLGNTCLNITVSSAHHSPDNLVSILKYNASASFLPEDFDFLCIDVDGSDYWLLHDMWVVGKYQPKVVCIEFNPTMPNDLIYIPERSDTIRHGASLSALVELADQHGYVLVETTLFNAFFVPQTIHQVYLQELVPDISIEALHEITMGTNVYQLYDGTLRLWGCKKMLWHKIGMDEKKMQMLPPNKRNFPFAPPKQPLEDFHGMTVDMSSFCCTTDKTNNLEAQSQCAKELVSKLKSDGFCLISGTGISQELCEAALSSTSSFLQDADESVRRSCLTTDRARRGYSPMCTENFASLVGEEGPNDLVRKFRMGPKVDAEAPLQNSLLAPNVWPRADTWDEEQSTRFQSTMEAFFESVCRASHSVVQAICQGLMDHRPELSESSISVLAMKDALAHTSILTLLGYRSGSRHKKGRKNKSMHPLVAAHTDVGVITVLLFDAGDCATLQRRGSSSDTNAPEWVDVTLPSCVPKDPIFVVNIADCLSDLSGGFLPSTLHRVVPSRGEVSRNCLALFVGLDPNATLSIGDETMSYEDWRKKRIVLAQQALRKQ